MDTHKLCMIFILVSVQAFTLKTFQCHGGSNYTFMIFLGLYQCRVDPWLSRTQASVSLCSSFSVPIQREQTTTLLMPIQSCSPLNKPVRLVSLEPLLLMRKHSHLLFGGRIYSTSAVSFDSRDFAIRYTVTKAVAGGCCYPKRLPAPARCRVGAESPTN